MNHYYNGVDNSAYLAHYGVLGMKWGQHLFGKDTSGTAKKSSTSQVRRTGLKTPVYDEYSAGTKKYRTKRSKSDWDTHEDNIMSYIETFQKAEKGSDGGVIMNKNLTKSLCKNKEYANEVKALSKAAKVTTKAADNYHKMLTSGSTDIDARQKAFQGYLRKVVKYNECRDRSIEYLIGPASEYQSDTTSLKWYNATRGCMETTLSYSETSKH